MHVSTRLNYLKKKSSPQDILRNSKRISKPCNMCKEDSIVFISLFGFCWFDEIGTFHWRCRGKKITCPGARDKLNFRQDKHLFSPNVLRTSKKFTDSLFFLDKDKLFGNRTSKNFDVLARGTSEKILDFFTPEGANMTVLFAMIRYRHSIFINSFFTYCYYWHALEHLLWGLTLFHHKSGLSKGVASRQG